MRRSTQWRTRQRCTAGHRGAILSKRGRYPHSIAPQGTPYTARHTFAMRLLAAHCAVSRRSARRNMASLYVIALLYIVACNAGGPYKAPIAALYALVTSWNGRRRRRARRGRGAEKLFLRGLPGAPRSQLGELQGRPRLHVVTDQFLEHFPGGRFVAREHAPAGHHRVVRRDTCPPAV